MPFMFTPSCCCITGETPAHVCGQNYGLQTFTSTSMSAYSNFMMGWDGQTMLGLRGDPGDMWYQTLIHTDGTEEVVSGAFKSNGMLDPSEAKVYVSQLEDVIIAGFQSCFRIHFIKDRIQLVWEPIDYITLDDTQGASTIVADNHGVPAMTCPYKGNNLHFVNTVDLIPLVRDQSRRFPGRIPDGITKVETVVSFVEGEINNGIAGYESSNTPFYNELDNYLNIEGYYWNLFLGRSGGYVVTHLIPCTLENNILTLSPSQSFIDGYGTRYLNYRVLDHSAPHGTVTSSNLQQFLNGYNNSPIDIQSLTQTQMMSGGFLHYKFGIGYQALLYVDAWYTYTIQ